jgi:hypothetical protein
MQTKRVAYASFNFPTWQQVGIVFFVATTIDSVVLLLLSNEAYKTRNNDIKALPIQKNIVTLRQEIKKEIQQWQQQSKQSLR